jgi:hypothetical protein
MRALQYIQRFGLLVVLFSLTLGCGGANEYATVPVSGTVTCNGKPLANGTINFTPMADQGRSAGNRGRVALGSTDKDGKFKLTTYQNDDGAIVGKHTVTISAGFSEETGGSTDKSFSCAKSAKEVTVERGVKEYKIDF